MLTRFDSYDHIFDGVLVIDKDYTIVFANKAFLDLCGREKESVIGKKCHEVSHKCPTPCNPSEVKCPYNEIFSAETPARITHKHCTNGGKVFSIVASPITDGKGDVAYMAEVLRDVTKEVELQNQLEKSESFLLSILEGIGEGVIVIDRDYRIISANLGYCRQVELSCDDIIGRHCFEVSHQIDKPCHENGEGCSAKEVFETGTSKKIVHTHLSGHGKPEYIETVSYPLRDADGNISAVIEVLTDITDRYERHQIEERLKYLFSISPATIYTCSPNDCGISFISDNVAAIAGHESKDFTDNPSFWIENIHPEDRGRVLADLQDFLNIDYQIHEYRFRHKDGSYRWIHDECRLKNNGDGTEIIGFWTDVTEHKGMEENLKNKIKELEEFYRIAVDREMKMIDLKKEIERLRKGMGNR